MAEEEFWYLSAMRTRSDSFLAQASLHHPVGKAANTGTKADVVISSITFHLFFDCLWLQILYMIWFHLTALKHWEGYSEFQASLHTFESHVGLTRRHFKVILLKASKVLWIIRKDLQYWFTLELNKFILIWPRYGLNVHARFCCGLTIHY